MIKDGVIYPSLEENVLLLNDFREDVLDGLLTMYLYGGGNIKGIVSTVDVLPATGENLGDGYLVGADPYDLYIWATKDGSAASWVPLGKFPAKGEQGTKGERGSIIINQASDPKNAPDRAGDYWVNTVTGDWFMSLKSSTASGGFYWSKRFNLKGQKGDRGPQGYQGVPGPVGPTGQIGPQGPKGTDGVGLNTLTHTDLVYGDMSTTYNTVDGLTISSTMRQTYDGTNHDSNVEYTVPIIGSDTISIDLDSGNNKLVVKLDQSKDIKIIGGAHNNVYFTSDGSASFGMSEGSTYSSFGNENGLAKILNKDPGGLRTYTFPISVYGSHEVLTDKYVKKIFGKSIVGSGNINLYRHVIHFHTNDFEDILFTVISSKDIVVNSLTDLKTLLGNTFEYPVSGTRTAEPIMAIKETGFATVSSYYKGDWYSYPAAGTWTDTVTTV